MTIFAILLPTKQPKVEQAIRDKYPEDHLMINDLHWLVSDKSTAVSVSAKLGIAGAGITKDNMTGTAIVFATSSYYGRAPSSVWDWIKAKLEESPVG